MNRLEAELIINRVLWSFHGTFYTWGGDDPSGFDCSGLAIEALKSICILPRKFDTTAHGLYLRYRGYHSSPEIGALAFFGTTSLVTHVGICLNDELMMEASGGGSFVKTREDAIKHNAFIKPRGINSRKDLVLICDPLSTKF